MGELLTKTYTDINRSARLITQKSKANHLDLINTTFIALQKKGTFPQAPDEFLRWFSRSMKIMHSFPQSQFNRQYRTHELNLCFEPIDTGHQDLEPSNELPDTPTHLSDKQANQYRQLQNFKNSLPLHSQYIFDLYYIGELSGDQICRKLNDEEGFDISRDHIYKLLKEVRIKFDIWKQQMKLQNP